MASSPSQSIHCGSNPNSKDEEKTRNHSVSSASSTSGEKIIYDREKALKHAIRWIVLNDIPFHALDDEDFETMIRRSFNSSFKRFSTASLRRCLLKCFKEEQEKLLASLQDLESKISLSYSIWTNIIGLPYICIRVHFIDNNWVMQQRTISFTALELDSIAETICSVLQFYNIQNKIFSITSDMNSDNIVAAGELKDSLTLPCDGFLFHMRSICNDLNNAIQSGLDDTREAIGKIRDIVHHITSSDSRRKLFLSICEKYSLKCEKLIFSDMERWDTVHPMLDVALQHKVAINEYASLENIYGIPIPPSDFEWDLVENIKEFLKTFYDAINILSSCYQPTVIHASLQIVNIIFLFSTFRSHHSFSAIMNKMEGKFRKSLLPLPILIGFGILLDPRLKDCGLSNIFASIYDDVTEEHINYMIKIKSYFEKVYNEYSLCFQNRDAPTPEPSNTSIAKSILLKIMSKSTPSSSSSSSSSKRKMTELELYLNSPLASFDDPKFNTLAWWKRNESNYPIISIMARDILAVPMSTVVSDFTFDAEGRMLDRYKSCLGSRTREALICLQDLYAAEERDQDSQEQPPVGEFYMLESLNF